MTAESQTHEMTLLMVKGALAELDAGAEIALKVNAFCASGCDLRGSVVRITGHGAAVVEEITLTEFNEGINETDEFVVKTPTEPGEYTWTAVFPLQEKEGLSHGESSVAFSFRVKPHTTSVEVWDVPSPVALGDVFRIRLGVRCPFECRLMDKQIEIYDDEGRKVASGTLGDVPWSPSTGHACAEVELKAPHIEGRHRWTAKFPQPDLELAHEGASCTFAFSTARQPDHVVTIEVRDNETKSPVKSAHVILRPLVYRGSTYVSRTDEGGVARLRVPKDEYQLYVSGDGKEYFLPAIEVAEDVSIKADLSVPAFDPDIG